MPRSKCLSERRRRDGRPAGSNQATGNQAKHITHTHTGMGGTRGSEKNGTVSPMPGISGQANIKSELISVLVSYYFHMLLQA